MPLLTLDYLNDLISALAARVTALELLCSDLDTRIKNLENKNFYVGKVFPSNNQMP